MKRLNYVLLVKLKKGEIYVIESKGIVNDKMDVLCTLDNGFASVTKNLNIVVKSC